MSTSRWCPVVCGALAAALVPDCGSKDAPKSEAVPAQGADHQVDSSASPATESPAAEEPEPDPVDPEKLKAGLAAIQPRITSMVEAAAPITVKPTSRYFIHPGENKNASMEIDTKGLSSLVLSPVIEDISKTEACAHPSAGIVELSWALDGHKPERATIDRNYRSTIPIDIGTASVLWLEVAKGNGTSRCDWFSLGFLDVKP